VLPFVNMSADADNEYFSDGVSEEILNVLARIPELKVSARTSAFSYKGSDATIAQIARELGVSHVLEGSVRKSGNAVRVTAQLIEAGSGFHLWSDTYDRELTNIFAIQDDIAQSIAQALKVRLLPAVDQPNLTGTTNLEAYELYLQGVNLWHLRTGEALERALTLFEQAIALDPGFARAHAYLGLTWAVIADYTDRPRAQTRVESRRVAEAALALDPDSVEAATVLINSTLADSPTVFEEVIERGRALIARNPGFATTHQWHATNLMYAGRLEEAISAYRAALELDPRSRISLQNLAEMYITLRKFDDAEQLLLEIDAFAPDYFDGAQTQFELYLLSGRADAARRAGERMARLMRRNRDATGLYLDLFFEPERKPAALAEILSFPQENWWSPDNPALIDEFGLPQMLVAVGAHDEALQLLRLFAADGEYYALSLVRASRNAQEFSCLPDVQTFYAGLGLPPLPNPPDSDC
jgi:TolB-like protein